MKQRVYEDEFGNRFRIVNNGKKITCFLRLYGENKERKIGEVVKTKNGTKRFVKKEFKRKDAVLRIKSAFGFPYFLMELLHKKGNVKEVEVKVIEKESGKIESYVTPMQTLMEKGETKIFPETEKRIYLPINNFKRR